MRAFDEPVIVVGHGRHVNETFDVVLDQLDEQPEGRDAGDVALELVADLVGHELHFLPLQQLALGVVGAPLHLGRVACDFGQLLREVLAGLAGELALSRRAERPVDDEVRISTDGRGEVRIARRREPEMSEIFRCISRLLHRPQHEERDRLLFRLAMDALEELLEVTWTQSRQRRPQAVTKARNEFFELLDLHHVRLFVDAIEGRCLLRFEV